MDQTALAYEHLIERFIAWAETCSDIRAAVVVGSRASVDRPADEWADLDVVVVTTDPETYLAKVDWLENLGNVWITLLEPTATGQGMERRALFEGGLDVDFTIVPQEMFRRVMRDPQTIDVLRRGVRVLLNKDGLMPEGIPSPIEPPSSRPPTRTEFDEMINDFWYHAVWTTKKLKRGELWTAKLCCDGYMKRLLLRMLEWHTRAMNGWHHDTWHNGRFLEVWADSRTLQGLRGAFAHYDEDDVRRALLATVDLFRWLAIETAEQLSYPYPTLADEHATELVRKLLSEKT
ncbi:MAG: aminoglycoside 6-adenylyltransferase [Chloroflexota bacterium]